jgi:HEAT repeat protein
MLKSIKHISIAILILLLLVTNAAAKNTRLRQLIDQVKGGACLCEFKNDTCSRPSFFSTFTRRHDKELCIIDAAKALGGMGDLAKAAIVPLVESLAVYSDIDTGDGILPVRSEIAMALGKIGDPSALTALNYYKDQSSSPAEKAAFEKAIQLIKRKK